MLIHDVEQGSPEWYALRLGIPTASAFDKILTPTGKLSTQAEAFINKLLAEEMTGEAMQVEKTVWMERGNELEQEAADYYELINDVELVKVGFCTNDAKTFGCSPDRLVGEEGALEIKVPAPHTHIEYLRKGEIDKGYWSQLQGNLLVLNRKWIDWMSYNPKMPSLILKADRDEKYLSDLQTALDEFAIKYQAAKQIMTDKGYL